MTFSKHFKSGQRNLWQSNGLGVNFPPVVESLVCVCVFLFFGRGGKKDNYSCGDLLSIP